MESPAEKYQRMMKAKMETLQSILAESEYCFTNTEDACGDEIYEIFRKAADISGGLLQFNKGETKPIDARNYTVQIIYLLSIDAESKTIQLEYKLERGINISEVAIELNNKLKSEGFKGDKYFYDITQDIDLSGLAFTDFSKELKLFEGGVLWRGRSEFENSEGFEYFWTKYNEHTSKTKGKDAQEEESKVPIKEELMETQVNEHEKFHESNVMEYVRRNQKPKKPWWKIW